MSKLSVLALAAIAALIVAAGVSAALPQSNPSQNHEDILRYWTAARKANAIPREVVLDDRGRVVPAKPSQGGKPGGGGGGETGAVTGTSWTGGGEVVNATGKVFFTLNGVNYVCSGTAVEEPGLNVSVVLTAAHCAFDEQEDEFALNWLFVSNYDDNGNSSSCGLSNLRCWTSSRLAVSQEWADSNASTINWGADYAFAVMNPNSAGELKDAVDGYAIGSAGPPSSIHAFGYPASRKYSGNDLTYCAGPTISDPYQPATNWGLPCNMTGGSSGGGWIRGFDAASNDGTLVGLNSYGYRGGPYTGYMFGPLFDGETRDTLNGATGAGGNVIVP